MMNKFNATLVEYLDVFNKFLAGIFAAIAFFKFLDLMLEFQVIQAFFETLTILGIGLLTCGYIAIMISIHNNLVAIRNSLEK